MSARSYLRNVMLLALVACKHAPEVDPAQVKAAATAMIDHSPVLGGAPTCKPEDLAAPVTLSFRSLLELAEHPLAKDPEQADWINPPVLDTREIATLRDPAADTTAKRRAAAVVMDAKAWLVYRIDLVNAPMALGVKELKIGTIGLRIIRYDRATMQPSCVLVHNFQNTRERSDWAIEVTNKPYVDPEVQRILREDLVDQMMKTLPRAPAAPAAKS